MHNEVLGINPLQFMSYAQNLQEQELSSFLVTYCLDMINSCIKFYNKFHSLGAMAQIQAKDAGHIHRWRDMGDT